MQYIVVWEEQALEGRNGFGTQLWFMYSAVRNGISIYINTNWRLYVSTRIHTYFQCM